MSNASLAKFPLSFVPAVAPARAAARGDGRGTYRSRVVGLIAGAFGLVSATQAVAQPMCKPALAFKEIRFSAMQPPTMERTWTAVLSVDASSCATATGQFELLFSRLKENGPEVDFREQFMWRPGQVEVSVNFWADEAVESYWLDNVSPCPCSR